ncbi:hypothetical protein [Caballeronia sp. LjRoot31]|uniref:terminase small subunit-like protein n=1 Tax=Caballeronia sp. LjRoot31 TaxID=3342324 RepID=UPI003ED11CAF
MDNSLPPRNAGRRWFPPVIFDIICERVASGQDLLAICSDPSMPSRTTFYAEVTENPLISAKYAAAVRTAVERRAAKTTV